MRFLFSCLLLFVSISITVQAAEYVVIGDSHSCGDFGQQLLSSKFGSSANTVHLYCSVSSAPGHWMRGVLPSNSQCKKANSGNTAWQPCKREWQMTTVAEVMAAHPRAKVVVALGTNSLMANTPEAAYTSMFNAVTAGGRACYWVGPPHLNPLQARGFTIERLNTLEGNLNSFAEGLKKIVQGRCHYLDSRIVTGANSVGIQTTDGVHRTPEAGRWWAQKVVEAVLRRQTVATGAEVGRGVVPARSIWPSWSGRGR